jgi:hypothetical protein
VHRKLRQRHVQRHSIVERDQLFREPRVARIVDKRLAAFLLLDLASAREQRLEIAVIADELGSRLDADARHARHIVGRIPDQRLHVHHLLGRHAEFLHHFGNADTAVFHAVVHEHTVAHELHEVLVRGDDDGGGTGLAGFAHVGRDQVVCLIAPLLEARNVESAHRIADERELRAQVIGWRRPVRFIVGEKVLAERLFRLVEDHREMCGPFVGLHFSQEFPQHVAEAEHGIHLQSVRFARKRRQGVIGAEDVGGAVDQEDMIAFLHRLALERRCGDGFLSGFDRHGRDLTSDARLCHLQGCA